MANKYPPEYPPEMRLYESFITLYKNKGYAKFLEIFNLAGQSLSEQVRSSLFSHVRILYENDLNHKRWIREAKEREGKEEEIDTELRKEGADVGTVATVGDGSGGNVEPYQYTYPGEVS